MEIKIDGKPFETVIVDGVQRFKRNQAIRYMVDNHPCDLNDLCLAFRKGKFPVEDYAEFYRLLGYSVSGFSCLNDFQDMEIENPLWNQDDGYPFERIKLEKE